MLAGGMINVVPFSGTRAAAIATVFDHRAGAVVTAETRRLTRATVAAADPRVRANVEVDRLATAPAPFALDAVIEAAVPGLSTRDVLAAGRAAVRPVSRGRAKPVNRRPAVVAGFAAAKAHRWRSVATTLLCLGAGGVVLVGAEGTIEAVVDEVVGCLRRAASCPNRVVLVARSHEDAAIGERTPDRPPGGPCPVSR